MVRYISLLLFIGLVWGQETYTDEQMMELLTINYNQLIKKDDNLYYQLNASIPYSGFAKRYWHNGNGSYCTYDFKHGLKHGKTFGYHSNGKLEYILNYFNNKMDEKCFWFYDDGKKRKETDYRNGVLHGKDISWYRTGGKQYEVIYENGRVNGLYQMWHENGNVSIKGNHINFLRHGQWIWYLRDNSINLIEVYDNGVLLSSDTF